MHLWMANNIDFGSFNFHCIKKLFFIFLVQKMSFFVKRLPKICYKNRPTKFKMILYHILCIIHHLFEWKKILAFPQKIDKYPPIQLEAGQI
jgi:hypothetical protein